MNQTDELLKLLDAEGPRLFRLLARLTLRDDAADDLLQELFLKLHRSPGFASAQSRIAFASRAAVNLAFDWRRRAQRTDTAPLPDDLAGITRDPLEALIRREEIAVVFAAMESLSELQRLVLILHYVEQQSPEEIGSAIDKSAHQVRALCSKAVAALRAIFRN